MTLRFRVASFISASFVLLAISLHFVFNQTLIGGVLELENQHVDRSIARVAEAVRSLENEVQLKAEEWGSWDDTYRYVKKRYAAYDDSNLTFESLSQLQLRHFLILDNSSRSIRTILVDADSQTTRELSPDVLAVLSKIARRSQESNEALGGLVNLEGGTFIVGAAPITNSAGDAPVRGSILFSRPLDTDTVERLRILTRLKLTLTAIEPDGHDFSSSRPEIVERSKQKPSIERRAESVEVKDVLYDVFGNPVLAVALSLERDLLQRGTAARDVVTFYVLSFTLVALVFSLLFLNKSVIVPLTSIGDQSRRIGDMQRRDLRVSVHGDTEIQDLSNQINRMLDSLSHYHAETERARALAESASNAKSRFLAAVSHELRTPLHGILGMLRLTKKSERDLTKISYLAMATSAAESLLTSINDLLDLSKAESGALAVVVTSCDVLECVHRALATVAPRVYEKREIELLLCNPPGHLPQVMADDARLGQVIVNLVGNSAKFTERGSIVVSIEVDTKLTITVSDTGIGIPVNRVSQVFEPFVQVDSSATRSNQGTGLGLTITKQLVEAMGGEISLSSVEGAGTSVQIRLSLATTVADNDTSTHRKFDSDVFLVARHPDLLRVLGAGLKEHGCNVSSVSTLEEVPHGWRGVALVDGAGLGDSSELMKLKTFIEASSQQVYVLLSPLQLEVHQSLVAISNCRILLKPCSAWSILSFFGTTASDCPRDQTQDAPAGPSLRVAIADDLPTSQIILAELLREGGHHVEVASNGVELLRILMAAEASGKPFDIVFSDVEMPQMDGVTVLKQVRERDLSRSTHLPFVLLTAHAFAEDKERFIALGADLVITKPIRPQGVHDAIARLKSSA